MDTRPPVDITLAQSAEQLEASRTLFREYAAQLGVDLGFQGFEDELAALPGDYGAPRGALLLASVDGELAGCCALRPIDDADYPNAAEMNRLCARKAIRGLRPQPAAGGALPEGGFARLSGAAAYRENYQLHSCWRLSDKRKQPIWHQTQAALACASRVAPSLTSNLPGASTFSVATLPSFTSIE